MHTEKIWQLIKNFRFNSIFVKYFVSVLLIIATPLLCITVFSIHNYNQSAKREMEYITRSNMNGIMDILDTLYVEVEKQSMQISLNQSIEDFIDTENLKYEFFVDIKKSREVLDTISFTSFASDYIHSVYVYSPKSEYIFSSLGGGSEIEFFLDNEWLEALKEDNLPPNFYLSRQLNDTMGVKIPILSSFTRVPLNRKFQSGYIIININMDEVFSQTNREFEEYIDDMIILNNGEAVYSYNENMFADMDWYDLIQKEGAMNDVPRYSNEIDEYIYVADSYVGPWKYIILYSSNPYLDRQSRQLLIFFTVLLSISVIGALVAALFVSMRAYAPIRDIIETLKKSDLGNLQESNASKYSELTMILSSISSSGDKIENLQKELEERMRLYKQAKSGALQAQINPHFICNVLESVNWMAIDMAKGENKVSKLIVMLSDFLRLSLNTENTIITIREEINHVKIYVDMQNICNKTQAQVVWNINENITDYKIMQFVLQPIVENAIEHGILPFNKDGKITISVRERQYSLEIFVEDNGIGMDEDIVEMFNKEMNLYYSKYPQSIGLRNVNQRIKLLYGEEYGITIQKAHPNGTVVKIEIPKNK